MERVQWLRDHEQSAAYGFLYSFLTCDYVMSYWLYNDDSGSHPGSDYQFLAGCFMRTEEWVKLLEEWVPLLRKYEISNFHTTELWDPSNETVLELFAELARVIFRRDYAMLWHGIDKTIYAKVATKFPRINESVFEFLVTASVAAMPKVALRHGDKPGHIGVVTAQGGPPLSDEVKSRIANLKMVSGFSITWQQPPRNETPQLEVADYCAWNYFWYRQWLNGKREGVHPPFIDLVSKEDPNRYWSRDLTEECLRDLFRQMDERK